MKKTMFGAIALLIIAAGVSEAEARIGGLSSQKFTQRMLNSDQFQLQAARIALEKSRGEEIRRLAQKIIDHHKASTEKLQTISKRAKISATDISLSFRQRRLIERLRKTDGARFDRYYVRVQRKTFKRTARILQSYAASGDNDDLKRLAKDTLPAVISHARTVKYLGRWRREKNVKF